MALNRSDKSRILRRYSPGMTRNSEMSTEPSALVRAPPWLLIENDALDLGHGDRSPGA